MRAERLNAGVLKPRIDLLIWGEGSEGVGQLDG